MTFSIFGQPKQRLGLHDGDDMRIVYPRNERSVWLLCLRGSNVALIITDDSVVQNVELIA